MPALLSFIDDSWQPGHILARDEQLLRWQFASDDPARPAVAVARDGGEIVGMLGVVPCPFNANGRRLPGAMLANWIVRADHRSQLLGLQLLRHVMQAGYALVGTLGGNATTLGVLGGLRFYTLPRVPRWARVLDVDAFRSLFAEQSDASSPELARQAGQWIAAGDVGALARRDGHRIVEWSTPIATRWDERWRSTIAPALRGGWRDAAHLDWRYVRHPRLRYRVRLALDEAGVPLALMVSRIAELAGIRSRVLRIVELLGDSDGLQALLADALSSVEGLAYADWYCTGTTADAALAMSGFVPEAAQSMALPSRFQPVDWRDFPLTAAFHASPAVTASSRDYFADPATYFTRADCDQDRPN